LFFFASCQPRADADTQEKTVAADSVSFPNQVTANYAKGFQISYHKNYKLLEVVRPFQDRVDTLRYVLVPREVEEEVDVEVENATRISTPVESLILTSATHIGLTDMLDINEKIIGLAGAEYIYNEEVKEKLNSGEIVALPQGELNKEKILDLGGDLLMISGGEASQFDSYKILKDSGVNIFVNSEWLETNPLGKAEWVKVMGALMNKEEMANQKFQKVAREYKKLQTLVDGLHEDDKPLVINNIPYKGTWYVSGGNSYMAQFFRDAGADYPWYDSNKSGGLQKDFEVVYEIGLRADVWINPGAATSKDDILAKDSRFKSFKPFENGRIYNKNKRTNASGGNDFWESGAVHPEKVLADLIAIFHPKLLDDHSLYFYQKIE
jgi:iron complex transport system substrate-binding protein